MVRVRYSALAKLFALVVFILIVIPAFMRYFDESAPNQPDPLVDGGGGGSGGGEGGGGGARAHEDKPRKNKKGDGEINRSEITVISINYLFRF